MSMAEKIKIALIKRNMTLKELADTDWVYLPESQRKIQTGQF